MEAKITSKTETEAVFSIFLDQDTLGKIKSDTLNHLRGKVKAQGFRPGKAPDSVVERELGSEYLAHEVLETAINFGYSQALAKENLPVIAPPNVEVQKFVPYTLLEYTAKVEIMPKVELGDYKKIKITRSSVEVKDSEVDQVLQDLATRYAKSQTVDRAAKDGDELTIDFEGFKDEEPFKGGKATDHKIVLGSKSFIPGFEEALVGVKAGESKDIELTFPKDYPTEELSGKPVTFKVTVKEVSERKLPDIDNAFAAEIGPFKTVDELKADITKQMTVEREHKAASDFELQVINEIVARSKVKKPESLVARQLERIKEEVENNFARQGLDKEKYLQIAGKTEEKWEQELRDEAERRVSTAMVLTEIASAEGLSVSSKDVEAELDRLRQQYKDASFQAELESPSIREEIYNHLMSTKTIGRILSYIEGEKK